MTQLTLIPIVLTIVVFISMSVMSNLNLHLSSTKDLDKLIIILLAFFTSLLVGLVVGITFSKLSKHKNYSYKERYFTPIIPIVYALIFAILTTTFSKGNSNSFWWTIYVFKNPLFLILDFVLFFSGYHFVVITLELMGYTGFLLGIILNDKLLSLKTSVNTPTNSKLILSALCITVVVFIGISSRSIINDGLVELKYGKSTVSNDLTEFDLLDIAPFKKDNGLATLKKEASLQFKELETLPRLDGATAAYPVYGAFVQAVYKGLGDYYEANKTSNDKDVSTAFVESDKYPYNIVKCTKTNVAYDRLMNKETDIIFVAEPSKAQLEAIKAKGDAFVLTPIGYEAFVFFTNTNNPVNNLSIKQIQDIYSGNLKNWKEVGGNNSSILPYQRPENSGSQTTMQNKVMKDIKMLQPSMESYAGGMGEIINKVAGYKNAKNSIGYSFMYYSSSMIKSNQIKYISVDGIKPTPDTVRNKTYPFTVPVYAVTLKSNAYKNVPIFLDWVLSEEGQSLVKNTGYIPAR
jgi:phosphate transport system substrate-binding protein